MKCPEADLLHDGLHHLLREGDQLTMLLISMLVLFFAQNGTIFHHVTRIAQVTRVNICLLYTSDAADE